MKDDLTKYVERRKSTDAKFAENYVTGYQEFEVGVLLRQAREQAGITQEDLARRTKTKKIAISRLEKPRRGRAPLHPRPRRPRAGQQPAD